MPKYYLFILYCGSVNILCCQHQAIAFECYKRVGLFVNIDRNHSHNSFTSIKGNRHQINLNYLNKNRRPSPIYLRTSRPLSEFLVFLKQSTKIMVLNEVYQIDMVIPFYIILAINYMIFHYIQTGHFIQIREDIATSITTI